ncbi:MAG TPA: hypothetical protein VK736_07590 [Candidatus Binatia bacterium]|nr:hypothetical protein [Candidatus Binatia bacterium]
MSKRFLLIVMVTLMGTSLASPVAANSGSVDTIRDFQTVLAVARPADFPVASLMRADCAFVVRVEHPDGSARETQVCQLSDEPVMIPAFQGAPPTRAFIDLVGPCAWFSDYWFNKNGTDVLASSVRLLVTPSGHVVVTSTYPAEPLSCE